MYALTTPQQNIWNLQRFYEGTSISNNCGAMFFGYHCDHSLLNRAINKLVELQDGMRLRFREVDGHPVQYVADYVEEVFSSMFFDNQAAFEEFAQQFARQPIDLIDGPMYRFVIFDVDGKSGVLLNASHMISDGWSFGIVPNTLDKWYRAFETGVALDEVHASYLPFIESEQKYFRSARYEKDKTYWAEQYPVRPELSSIKPNSVPVQQPKAKRYTTLVPSELSSAINGFYSESNVSQAALFETAIITYLSRINPENRAISIGVPVLNRSGAAEKRAIGMCISTTPLTVPVSRESTAEELCRTVSSCQFKLFRHQRFPYSHILHDLHERYDFSGNLYDVIVSFQNAKSGTDTKTQWLSNGYCEVGLEFHIDNRDDADCYTLNIDYQTDLFRHEEEVALLVNRILYIIEQIIRDPAVKLNDIQILPDGERQKVLFDFNQTQVPFLRNKCVHELFSERAMQTPNKTALVFEGQCFTYQQLDEMSNSLAHYLKTQGIAPGAIVPIISKRSWHVIVAMLGILKAGGAYMPVDPTYPKDRIDYMFETAQCNLALTYGYSNQLDIVTLPLERFDFHADVSPVENRNHSEDLCYIIFTSGSTGKPKGVSLCHRNVVNYSDNNRYNVCHSIIEANTQSIVSVTNIIFDIFVTESLFPLLNGICIYFANDEQVFSQKKLAALIDSNTVDVLQTTPTKMRSYIMDKQNVAYLKRIKAIVLGGEALPVDLYLELRNYTDARIFNIYGPAETTVWSTKKCVEDTNITIGKPIANTQVYILDANRKPLPIGVAGELCISGDGVGKGYLNRPELTAERFISNPFIPGTTMYCTGDLARWRADGEIEYLGRIDTQVKIRGLRIELGEIESVMSQFDGIQLAAVTDKRDEAGYQYLVGYYTAETEIDKKELRHHLSTKLPKYMVPNYLVHLDEMPMTASGKTDRKNLPAPEFTFQAREYVAPDTQREMVLCEILADLLQSDQIGVTDDFFELGGDSLRAIEYVALAHNQGIDFALQNVFDYPTVRSLCEYLDGTHNRKVIYNQKDFAKYDKLLAYNHIDESFVPQRTPLGNVLLTGATGFLGSHIIDQFMKAETGKIYCLVRGGQERLAATLAFYFGEMYSNALGGRIVALEGDITQNNLPEIHPRDVQTVIHTAATVKHYGPYSYFDRVNVQGTRNILNYVKQIGAKMLHISTISVSGNSLVDAFDVCRVEGTINFTESNLFVDQPLDNVYIHSKFEAERAVLDAGLDGVDVKIIRVGNLTNRLSDLKFQPNYTSNAFLSRVKAALELGLLPDYLMHLYAEFSPIDQTAEGVIKIGEYASEQTVFHLNNHRNLYFDRMLEILNDLGVKMEVVDGKTFHARLQQAAQNTNTEYIYEAFQNDMDENGNLIYDSNIHILNDFTVWFMRKLGFEWADIDYAYLKGYIEYFRNLGYLGV